MQKTLKRLFILLLSAAVIACVAIIGACNKEETVEEGKMVIYVYKPDGTLVNGLTDGDEKSDGTRKKVSVQFCLPGGGCNNPLPIGEDGKITLDIENDILKGLKNFPEYTDNSEIVVHILNMSDYESDGDYGTFTKATLHHDGKPYKITLKAKAA